MNTFRRCIANHLEASCLGHRYVRDFYVLFCSQYNLMILYSVCHYHHVYLLSITL